MAWRHEAGNRDEERRRCGLCGKILRPYDSISVAKVGARCCRCFNQELADRLGVDFDNTPAGIVVAAHSGRTSGGVLACAAGTMPDAGPRGRRR